MVLCNLFVCRWENSSLQSEPGYVNWTGGVPANANNLDCVVFAGTGWQVHQTPCATDMLPHVCKMFSKSSVMLANIIYHTIHKHVYGYEHVCIAIDWHVTCVWI